MLRVSQQPGGEPEIFYSLQGEGANLGTPSVFLRLALCNLACTWCDTRYTWDWEHYDYATEVVELSQEETLARISAYPCTHLVVTGGEPLLQQRSLASLLKELKASGYSFEIETNGTILPTQQMVSLVDQWNVSPKLSTSGNSLTQRRADGVLAAFAAMSTALFKFVVTVPEDLQEVQSLVAAYQVPTQRVYLMPEGTTKDALAEKGPWISQACMETGFRFSPRLHILLWGDRRGT